MANQPNMDKRMLSVRVPQAIYRRLQKMAAKEREGFNVTVKGVLGKAVDNVQLTPADYAQIKKEMEADIAKRIAKGRRTKIG